MMEIHRYNFKTGITELIPDYLSKSYVFTNIDAIELVEICNTNICSEYGYYWYVPVYYAIMES